MYRHSRPGARLASIAAFAAVMTATTIDVQVHDAHAASVCPNVRIMGTAVGVTRERAKKKARGQWESKARRKYGTSRISWWRGRDRDYTCRRKRLRFYCFAFAKPCF
jgi:hypothetical protein